MKFFNKYILAFGLIVLSMVGVLSCTKDGNNNKLAETVPPAEYQGKENDGVIKILAIGNSFSEDAVETHLYDLANAEGIKVMIGNLYIGGASLQLHQTNATNNASIYDYRKINELGVKKNYPKTSILTALQDEHWDYISFQQVSQNSGQFDTYQASLPLLFDYVKSHNLASKTKFLLHQTWAYAQSSIHPDFVNYDKDQMKMYLAIVNAVEKARTLVPIDQVIPAGTAIQNGRTSIVGDAFCRDGYHLSIPLGRFTAACTWFESLFGKNVVNNTYKPTGLSEFEITIAKNAAHLAIQKPNAVTEMLDFQGGSGPLEGYILLSFDTKAAPAGWNGLTGFLEGASVSLKNNTGNFTGISASITERFNGVNTAGEKTTTTDFKMTEAISTTSFFGNSKLAFGGVLIPQSVLKIKGLNKQDKYSFCYFGSRSASTDNRETKFITKGKNEVIVKSNTSNNTSEVVCATGIEPNDLGEVSITITSGENNNNSNGFYYINAMRIAKTP